MAIHLLSNEIDFMSNYIDLMKLRMSEKGEPLHIISCKFEDISVPPLLFIPFIENAFKHGISYREKSFIEINMEVSKNLLYLRVKTVPLNKEKKMRWDIQE